MVELVDTLTSGASPRKRVGVRVSLSPPKKVHLAKAVFYILTEKQKHATSIYCHNGSRTLQHNLTVKGEREKA